jgi:hypothetical protein
MSGDTERGTSPRPDPADLRASDAERDDVATALGDHFQAGRLSQAEFGDRVSAALGARTRRDLSVLLTDLPASPVAVTEGTGGVRGRGGVGVARPDGVWGREGVGAVQPGATGGAWGRGSVGAVQPGGTWGRGRVGAVQPGGTGGVWGRGRSGAVQPGGTWTRGRSGGRVLPVLVPLLVAAFVTAGLATHGWGAGDSGGHAAGPWPLFLLFWVIPLVAFGIRRRRWARRAGSAGRQGSWQ